MNFRIQSYLQFLWHSKNEHGVHSPFVFLLLTQGLYTKKVRLAADALSNPNKSVSRKQQLLYKIIRYFEPKSILTIGATPSEIDVIALGSPKAKFESDCDLYHCIFIHSDEFDSITNEKLEQLLKTTENDSFWILESIHANRVAEAFWSNLKSNPKVTVTIDTFHFGLVFFRKEQVEEHFILRV
ncbi:MAG TPA: hypothetical protein DD806_04430 [Flavobacterium sp.]|nr:hypothetical protein [Flavobacterium sp.]